MVIDHNKEHYCPVYDRVVDPEFCYEKVMLSDFLDVPYEKDVKRIYEVKNPKELCNKCSYSNME